MSIVFEFVRALTIVAFLVYGASILLTNNMVAEFERYGLSRLRTFTGWLQVLGALGLLLGYWYPMLGALAAASLALLMALGIATRLRAKDPVVAMLPAAMFCALNSFLFTYVVCRFGTWR